MIILTMFAFLAGVVTILSPCILPILPIILSSTINGENSGKARPLGVVMGFILSFTFFTLFLSTIVNLSGISANALRVVSVFIIAGFGVSLLIPQFQVMIENLFSKLGIFMPKSQNKTGFHGGVIIGLSVGLLWTPCVGPILASVISLAITGTVTFDAFIITISYALGTAIPMFLIILGGQNALHRVPWLLSNLGRIQKLFGVVMILTALAIFLNLDRKFQTFILSTFPKYGVGLTQFEDSQFIKVELQKQNTPEIDTEKVGQPTFDLSEPKGPQAPELMPGGAWFNSAPLKLADLKGKVVIVDFFTYTCINCQRTFPYLRTWYENYSEKGLVIIGVHSPEFEFEKNKGNVEQAIKDFDLTYPIMQDNDFATWRAYDNHYWPAKYIIDKDGRVRYSHFGEGDYDETEQVIQELLEEAGAAELSNKIDNPTYDVEARTPELYLGYGRIDAFASLERIKPEVSRDYTAPQRLGDNQVAYDGVWNVMEEYAHPQKGSSLTLNFESKEVFLVMRNNGEPARIKVYIDDIMQDFGEHNINGIVTVENDQLYKIIQLQTPGRHTLRLEFEDNHAELFAFTFG